MAQTFYCVERLLEFDQGPSELLTARLHLIIDEKAEHFKPYLEKGNEQDPPPPPPPSGYICKFFNRDIIHRGNEQRWSDV